MQVSARSISRPVLERLAAAELVPHAGLISAVFERAVHLAWPDGELFALVSPELGDGPLNIVLRALPGDRPQMGALVQICPGEGRLEIGRLQVLLGEARIWEPRPDWEHLRARATAVQGRLPHLATLARSLAPRDSLVSILAPPPIGPGPPVEAAHSNGGLAWADSVLSSVSGALELLLSGWAGDRVTLLAAAARLAGLGSGLTPSGDDFLLGVMLWSWLAHSRPGSICGTLLDGSRSRTTSLSTALLGSASRGECSQPWHRLLESLETGSDDELAKSVRSVLDYGHTSGADALAGFIWMGLHTVVTQKGAHRAGAPLDRVEGCELCATTTPRPPAA